MSKLEVLHFKCHILTFHHLQSKAHISSVILDFDGHLDFFIIFILLHFDEKKTKFYYFSYVKASI